MANRRMFAKAVIGSGRFLRMPPSSRLLYYDLGMSADDEGVVEAYPVLRTTGATEDDLRILIAKGFIQILDPDELVAYLTDWNVNNTVRKDRFTPSIYHDLLIQIVDLPEPLPAPEPEPEQVIPVQPEPEQPAPKREYKGKSWGTEKVDITEEAKAEAAHLAAELDARTPGAPPTSGQKKAAYARAIQELINRGNSMKNIRGTLDWLVSDSYGTDYYRGRILSDAAVLRNEFKPMLDKALSAFSKAQAQAQAGR